jgi:putative DNA methylase
LPLERINRAAVRENQGRTSPLHLWWSHKPGAACRAVLLASVLDEPATAEERNRLLDLVGRVAEARPGGAALDEARRLIRAATGAATPVVLDPFCGSGSIPAEAQRLGLPVHAADLNPVAVLMTLGLLELPGRFAGRAPVHPGAPFVASSRIGGLIADVLHYGRRVRQIAADRIGHLYPADARGRQVIAWLWTRTAPCPNPACRRPMPLIHSFTLSAREGREAWLAPSADGRAWRLGPAEGVPPPPEGTVTRTTVRCLHCGTVHPLKAIRQQAGRTGLGMRLLCLVVRDGRGRTYAAADGAQEEAALGASAPWAPETELPEAALGFGTSNYGIRRHRDLYTPRQLVALTTFSEIIRELRAEVAADARRAGWAEGAPLRDGGAGARAYAEAVSLYLALALDRAAAKWCTFARWHRTRENIEHPFATPGLPMPWDFPEANPFSESTGNWLDTVEAVAKALAAAPAAEADVPGAVCRQADAAASVPLAGPVLVCTDPPYFDKVPFADTADLFYIWLRPTIGDVFADLFRTVLTPKAEELVADRHRFGGTGPARQRFLQGMAAAFKALRAQADPRYPLTIFYAFQEGGGGDDRGGPVGWEVLLESLIAAGLQITATWPLRTEHAQRLRSIGSNTLASAIILVCRPRPSDAPTITRRDFAARLRRELPAALAALGAGGVSPADLAQAAIGPGMAVFSGHTAVLTANGQMPVGEALRLIGESVEAYLAAGSAEFDPATRLCLAWAELHGFDAGAFGEAEVLARAKSASLDALRSEGIAEVRAGHVRLLSPEQMRDGAPPSRRSSLWAVLHHLAAGLAAGGEAEAAAVGRAASAPADDLRALAYRLYVLFDHRGEAAAAVRYDEVAEAMPQVAALAARAPGASGEPLPGS